jgi:hypothetical protein
MLTEIRVALVIAVVVTGLIAGLIAVGTAKIIAAVRAARALRANALDRARVTDAAAGGRLTAEADRFIRSRQAAWRLRC